jgi:DNA-binding transcriptional regulator YhcF (GntR family)
MAISMDSKKELGRTPEKRRGILKAITENIVSGKWPLGEKIPNRVTIEKTFKASSVTVQRAMELLTADGFLEPRGRNGTFVSMTPPYLHNYAIVFSGNPKRSWSALLESIALEAGKLKLEGRSKIRFYYDINGDPRAKDYGRLISDIRAHRLAGIFFSTNPYEVANTPIIDEGDIPRVAITNSKAINKFVNLILDGDSVGEMGINYLIDKGCRKIGLFMSAQQANHLLPLFKKIMSERNCVCRDEWIQSVNIGTAWTAVNVVKLLFKLDKKDIPDGIYIADDNLTAHVIEGIRASNRSISDDILLSSHSNFPATFDHPDSVKLFGFNINQVLLESLRLIDLKNSGMKTPSSSCIKACSEDEFEKAYTGI